MANRRGFARWFTLEEVRSAQHMRDVLKMEWPEVARRLGPDVLVSSLMSTVSLYRNGKWTPKAARRAQTRVEMERMVTELGVTDVETIAAHFGMTPDNARWNLRTIGLDHEMRREIRRDFDRRRVETGT